MNNDDSVQFNTYCNSLWECLTSTLNTGLRAGGGIGEWLKQAFKEEDTYWGRYAFDLLFYIVINIILLNVIFGIIIDTFADLRDKRNAIITEMNSNCFICGLRKNEFDLQGNGFVHHITTEHNINSYLAFIIYVKQKAMIECNGIEKYCNKLIDQNNTSFMPKDAICLQQARKMQQYQDEIDQMQE